MKEIENPRDILKIDPSAIVKTYKKGQIIQRAGDNKPQTIFVNQGLLRSYIIDTKGKEHIFTFAPENWIVGDAEALEFNEPIKLFIDCLEDTEVLIFDNNSLFREGLSREDISKNARMLYRRLGVLQRRVLMLMGSPAIDRYQYFLSTYPELPNRIPQRMIATFLGITPQALSTIRSKIAKSGN